MAFLFKPRLGYFHVIGLFFHREGGCVIFDEYIPMLWTELRYTDPDELRLSERPQLHQTYLELFVLNLEET